MGSKKWKESAVSGMHYGSNKPDVGVGGSTSTNQQLTEKEKALDRVKWLKTLSGQLLREASELEAKWGPADAGDAIRLDVPGGTADGVPDVTAPADDRSRKSKSKKDKKRKKQDLDEDAPAVAEDASAPTEFSGLGQDATSGPSRKKKDSKKARETTIKGARKANKAKKGNGKEATEVPNASNIHDKSHDASSANAADKWNISALGGGTERQNKFMKLLGGGKAAPSPLGSQDPGKAPSKYDVAKYQDDLQKQYDAGIRMKFESQGQRRGLGA